MFLACSFIAGATAQKKNAKQVKAYAITSVEKGNGRWTEVREVDLTTGQEVKSVYKSAEHVTVLNARTGKAIIKKQEGEKVAGFTVTPLRATKGFQITGEHKNVDNLKIERKLVESGKLYDVVINVEPDIYDKFNEKANRSVHRNIKENVHQNVNQNTRVLVVRKTMRTNSNAPFATQSAACAYDKKHDRLYYTPMGINQLRYIDLKSKNPQVYFFEGESFGAMSGPGDVQNQITRMVIAGDGNGYALTNNANHLIRFSTNKKAVVTDLGALSDDATNGRHSVHNNNTYGGDMVADKSGNLYLITAHRAVYKINIESRVAQYKGTIKGLPAGFTTNGAAVEKGTSVIVSSATATSGYYRFDVNKLVAEKVSESESVYNASDLANANLISYSKKDKEEAVETIVTDEVIEALSAKEIAPLQQTNNAKITVFPNPVTSGTARVVFNNFKSGRYELQLLSMNGMLIQKKSIIINAKAQQTEINNLMGLAKGSYLVNVINEQGVLVKTEKIIVQ